MTNPLKNEAGKISTVVKVVGIVLTLSAGAVGYGELRTTVATNAKDIDKQGTTLTEHEKRLQNIEIERARHEEIDKQIVDALKELKEEMKRKKK